jgi:hypothetical protein
MTFAAVAAILLSIKCADIEKILGEASAIVYN